MKITEDVFDSRTNLLLGLTDDDRSDRKNWCGASDANIILSGDEEKVYQLWGEKVEILPPVDLSDVLPVQLGIWSEDFNLMWAEKKTGRKITHRKHKQVHADISYLRASLDGVMEHPEIDGLMCVVDAKHVSPFNYSAEKCLQKYAPQLAIQMACMDLDYGLLSILSGTFTWEWIGMKRDKAYEQKVLDACETFWFHVQTQTPPGDIKSVELSMPVSMMRKVDLSLSNEWIAAEQDYLAHEKANVVYETAKKSLKALVEADVSEAKGRELVAKRDKNGSIRFSKIKAK